MDYRRYGHSDYRAYGATGVPSPVLPARTATSGFVSEDQRSTGVPVWWIWVISLYCIPLAIANIVINNILLPPLITSIVGNGGKEAALGLVTSLVAAIHSIEPFLGVIADRCPWRYRRRAFIVIGQSCTALGVAGMWFVDHHHEWHLLVGAYFVFHFGNMAGWVPYVAIVPELPSHQRATGAAIIGFTSAVSMYAGSMLGLMIGQRWISTDVAFALMLVLNVVNIPLGCLAMGDRPGCFTAERPLSDHNLGTDDEVEKSTRQDAFATVVQQLSYPRRFYAMATEFLSAFWDSAAYRWMFVYSIVRSLNPFGAFTFYWYQDCFVRTTDFFWSYVESVVPRLVRTFFYLILTSDVIWAQAPDFNFFGWHLASSPQSATAILVAMGQVISTVTALPGGVLDTRFLGNIRRRKRVLLAVQLIGIPVSVVYLFNIDFTIVVLLNVWIGVSGGLLSPVNQAFGADCLPVDTDGRPSNPTRDTLIAGWSGILPGIVTPIIGGKLFALSPDRRVTYHWMFVWQLVLAVTTTFIFAGIPVGRHRDVFDSFQSHSDVHHVATVPIGARMCDRLLFGMHYDTLGRPTRGGAGYRRRADYTRELAEKRVSDYRASSNGER